MVCASSQAKLVSSMDDLAPLATGLAEGETPKLGQELLHNVGLMVGLAETEIQVSGVSSSEIASSCLSFSFFFFPF